MGITRSDEDWMRQAIHFAQHAAAIDEVPIAAVLVRDDQLIAQAWNQPISDHDPTAHAEIRVLRQAALSEKNYRLVGTTLYVTLEPCLMCFGALINARVSRLVYGASDKRFGVVQALSDSTNALRFNHQIEIAGGVLAQQSAALLEDFFKQKRKKTPPEQLAE